MIRKGRASDMPEGVHRISGVRRSLTDEIDDRTRRYLFSMGLRTACFLGAVLAWVAFDQVWLGWLLLVGAVLLPYIAVVVANAGRERPSQLPTITLSDAHRALPAPTPPETDPTARTTDSDEPRIA